jgi:signal transduction histidine kinase/DNA-binding response OmpR family regulator
MRRFVRSLVLVALSVVTTVAQGQSFRDGYRIDQFTTDNGLPAHAVHDLLQTPDGFLWIATNGGLARFDGLHFTTIAPDDPRFAIGRVGGVAAGRGDTVWFIPEGGGIGYVTGGRAFPLLSEPQTYDLEQDSAGTIWLMGFDLLRYQNGRMDQVVASAGFAYASATDRPRIWKDDAGVIWIREAGSSQLQRIERGTVTTVVESVVAPLLGNTVSRERFTVRRARVGAEVVARDGTVIARVPGDTTRFLPRLVDRTGRVWGTTPSHIEVYGATSRVPVARFPLDELGHVVLMAEDREGNIWIGTGLTGLWRFQPVPFTTIGVPEGLRANQAVSIHVGVDGEILTIDETFRLFHVRDGRAIPMPLGGARSPGIRTYLVDRRGTQWYSEGPLDETEQYQLVGLPTSGAPRRVSFAGAAGTVVEDPQRDGVLWVRQPERLLRVDTDGADGPAITRTYALGRSGRGLLVDRDGVVWATGEDATGYGTLWRVHGDSVRAYGADDGIPAAQLRGLHQDADGALWIGTYGAGLLRWNDGVLQGRITTREGLADDVVSGIVADDAGNLWFAGNRGVHRAARSELLAVIEGRAERVYGVLYGRGDGLVNPEGSGRVPLRAPDGRLWFPTFGGAAVIDPGPALALDATPPTVRIAGEPEGEIRLPRGLRRLEVAYHAVTMRRPDALTYEYQLTPLDPHWVSAGSNTTLAYSALRPGQYTLAVRAVNAGGISSAPATISVVVPPYVYETAWFWLLVLLFAAAGVWQWYQWRVRQLYAREVELGRLVTTRTAALSQETRRAEEALATVAAQADQLRTLDEAKSRFFANVSHEFRTPLSLVLGPLEDLRAGREGRLTDAMEQKLDRVIANSRRLVRLVEQLLDVARLEAGVLRLDLEVRDLVPLLRRVTESFASMAERRWIDFRLSCPVGGVPVRYDPDQMDKVLANLCGNALKFTESGGVVQLQATVESHETGSWVVVTVSDSGIGIPAERLHRIFDRFYQVDDSPQRAHEGTGIGLAITKELLELHGGRIHVTSREGVGTVFTMRLPLAREDARRLDPPTPPRGSHVRESVERSNTTPAHAVPSADDRTTVLVVEDNAELRDYLREHLRAEYHVIEAGDGRQGLAMAQEHVPDLIISDIMMPGLDGQALCTALKGDPETNFIPVILLTARASQNSRLAGLTEGADDYLTKPVDMRELLIRSRNLITVRRRLRERFGAAGQPLPTLTLQTADALEAGSQVFLERLNVALAAHVGDEDFQVETLAAKLAVSRATLYRRIEAVLGKSPMDVIWQYRVDQAALWLRETDATVSEVAYAVGFKSVPHFSRRFREQFGVSPSQFRTQTRT